MYLGLIQLIWDIAANATNLLNDKFWRVTKGTLKRTIDIHF